MPVTEITPLTGPYDTARLESLSGDPITVTVERTPLPGHELEFATALGTLVGLADGTEGSLGVGLFEPGEGSRSWQTIGRFTSAHAVSAWEHSGERLEALAVLDPLTESVTVAVAHDPVAFLDAVSSTSRTPRMHEIMLDALWSLPIAGVVALMLSAPGMQAEPLALRLVGSCVVFSAAMFLMVHPLRGWMRRRRDRRVPLR